MSGKQMNDDWLKITLESVRAQVYDNWDMYSILGINRATYQENIRGLCLRWEK
jgi:hypothetical protein